MTDERDRPSSPTSLGAISEETSHVVETELTGIVRVNTTPRKKSKNKQVSFADFDDKSKAEFIKESQQVDETDEFLESKLSDDLSAPYDADSSESEGEAETRSKKIASGLFVQNKAALVNKEDDDEDEQKKKKEEKFHTCNLLISIFLMGCGLGLFVPEFVATGSDIFSQDYQTVTMVLIAILCILTSIFSFCFFSFCYMEPKDFKDQCDVKLDDLTSGGQTIGGHGVELILKDGWKQILDSHSGHHFYHNVNTDEVTWIRPVKEVKRLPIQKLVSGSGSTTGSTGSEGESSVFNVWLSAI
jgi:hypothetical protein